MSAPISDPLAQAASTTSSGFADGLGRRALAFDREEGTMLERLVLRPELAAFEAMLRERVERVSAVEDERIARPRTIERDADASLVVVSEFVPGSRLSDLLDTAAEMGTAPGVDAALGFLLDVLPALCGLHAGAGFAHGTVTPARIVLTPAGQVVLLDAVYGGALSHLRYSRRKLWTEFGVAAPAVAGAPRLDAGADIAQVALAALMLVLGRRLRVDEYPDGLSNVLLEVVEIAEIRSTITFATGFQNFLQRALALPNHRPYTRVDDALIDLRDVASELGLQACRRALVEFIEQMESAGGRSTDEDDIDSVEENEENLEQYGFTAAAAPDAGEELPATQDLAAAVDAEINLDDLVEDPHYELDEAASIDAEPPADAAIAAMSIDEHVQKTSAGPAIGAAEDVETPRATLEAAVSTQMAGTSDGIVTREPDTAALPAAAAEETPTASSVRSRRAKRPTRSARARKDKLRSAALPPPPPAPAESPHPAPAPTEPASPWLVAPNHAAAFESPVDDVAPPPASRPLPIVAPPPTPVPYYPPIVSATVLPETVATRTVAPIAPVQPEPVFSRAVAPIAPVQPEPVFSRTVAPIIPAQAWTQTPSMTSIPLTPQLTTAKLKEPVRKARTASSIESSALDIYSAPAPVISTPAETTAFPWKLAAAAVIVITVGIVGGRIFLLPGTATTEASATPPAAPVAAAPLAPISGIVAQTGRLEIETQPAGARVLLDGKPAGESPVALDGIAAGRHVVTFVSASGSVRRTVRVETGRTVKLDVPIFSGWVGIFAPFVVEVAEAGHVIGTTEEPRLMLSPGRHELTLTNKDLGYRSMQSVDIEPGELRSISIDPRGIVSLNASPWAEVWIDGQKAGDTPLANLELRLGIREVVFRHPEFGERRVTVTVRGNAPATISVDMSKPATN